MRSPIPGPARLVVVVLGFVAWTFLFSAAIGSPIAVPAPGESGGADFRIVYDVLWLTSAAAFALLADRAFGADRQWLRQVRRVLVALVALGAVAVPTLMIGMLIR